MIENSEAVNFFRVFKSIWYLKLTMVLVGSRKFVENWTLGWNCDSLLGLELVANLRFI